MMNPLEWIEPMLDCIEYIEVGSTYWNGSNLLDKLNPSKWNEYIVMGWKFYILLRIGGQKDWIAQICTQLYVIRKHEKYTY